MFLRRACIACKEMFLLETAVPFRCAHDVVSQTPMKRLAGPVAPERWLKKALSRPRHLWAPGKHQTTVSEDTSVWGNTGSGEHMDKPAEAAAGGAGTYPSSTPTGAGDLA